MTRPTIRLHDANLQQLVDLYSKIEGRTALQHPLLKRDSISLTVIAKGDENLADVFEQLFKREAIAVIPDGEKFVMVVPNAITNRIRLRAKEIEQRLGAGSANEEILPPGSIKFLRVDMRQALMVFAELTGRKLSNPDQVPPREIHFLTVSALSRSEVVYALETLFAWNGIQIVPVGSDTFKVVSLPPERQGNYE